jgi:hypothetical protein
MGHVETVTVLVESSDDIAGEWVAHVLELDVVTQGRSDRSRSLTLCPKLPIDRMLALS